MPRPAPTPPDIDRDNDLIGWDDGDDDAENRSVSKREESQPAGRRAKAEPALTMPPVQKEEALGLGGKKPAGREPSLSAGKPLAPDADADNAPVLEAPAGEPKLSQVPDGETQKLKRAARVKTSDVGGLLYLIALAIFAAALSAAVVLMVF